MKGLKKFGLITLTVVMTASLFGCGNDNSGDGKTAKIKWYNIGTRDADHDVVMEEFNKQLKEKYGMEIEMNPISMGDYNSKMQVINAAHDVYDLMWTGGTSSFYKNVRGGALADITELLPQTAPTLYESLSKDVWNAASVDGKIYAVPNWQIMAMSENLVIPSKFLNELGMTNENINTMADVEDYLVKINKLHPEADQLLQSSFPYKHYKFIDIYDSSAPGMIKIGDGAEGVPTIVNQYASPEFREFVLQRYDWVKRGLSTNTYSPDNNDALKRGRQPFYFGSTYKPGADGEYSDNIGVDLKCKQFSDALITTGTVMGTATGVSATSKQPEKALKFVEIINTDKDLYNLLTWGIEGTHYDKVSENVIKPRDLDVYGYYNWSIGSVKNSYVLESQPEDVWEQTEVMNNNAVVSPLMGFAPDIESISTTITDCQTVLSEKLALLVSGLVEPEKGIADLLSELEAAGSQKIIDELQRQLNEWWKTK